VSPGSYYCVPNDGQAQFSLPCASKLLDRIRDAPIKPHPTDRSPIQDSGLRPVSASAMRCSTFCAATTCGRYSATRVPPNCDHDTFARAMKVAERSNGDGETICGAVSYGTRG